MSFFNMFSTKKTTNKAAQQTAQAPNMQVMQQQQANMQANIQQQAPVMSPQRVQAGGSVRALKYETSTAKDSDALIAVIVTICGGSSYDDMFKQISQEGPEGTRIACYEASPTNLEDIKTEMAQPTDGSTPLQQLCQDIAEVDADSVVFNWECCSSCSEGGFGGNNDAVISMMGFLIGRGHMVMCSDFSLKALIGTWKEGNTDLGPNPFKQLGTFSNGFKLAFDPKVLSGCPSSQLQKVGDLCPDGEAAVHALGSTIVYSVDKGKADNSHYKCEVLSIIPNCGSFAVRTVEEKMRHSIGKHEGVCGHVILTYPSGGKLLTSCGHWIELIKLDVSEEALIKAAQMEYGDQYCQQMQSELASCDSAVQRKQFVQQKACRMVQSAAPMEYAKGYGRSKASYQGKVRR